VPFRMRVRLGNLTYLPLEMSGAANLFTRPAERSRVDLTLGVDADGDGLPDAWERAMIQMLGGNLGLDHIRPGDDSDGDGLSNLDEYLAGTYAFDPADGFALALRSDLGEWPVLEFTAIRGRSYSVLGSEDLNQWVPITFALPTDPVGPPTRNSLQATETRLIRARVSGAAEGASAWRFYRLQVH